MSIFGKIKDAIFGSKAKAQEVPETAPSGAPKADPGNAWANAPVVEPKATSVVDVENSLDSMPGADRLNWRTSIVDLMKLIGVDSDYESRKALAGELGREDYSGSAEDNIWLHKRTMNELAANGGKVPAEFLD
ncbi:DUF3597 domain-containing protein [Qipengyuania sp. 6B39]|uniref:DUF3597 domain-containing protein n=1 Tax=Qipengyuania proteolytica TaxID=2867239 RepID=UPI001C8AF5BF|nr:DUF3597 domain-containing protein [Qipengyuania proteolytica]MBX7496554.1 DUF3597 domain-containing protein [Qipengyuania proteolytica]